MTTKNCCPSVVPCTALHRELLAASRCLHPRAPSLPRVAASCYTPGAAPSRTASALPSRAAPHDADHRACAAARPSSPATPQSRRFRTTPRSGPQSAVPAPESGVGNPLLTQAWPPRTRIVPPGRGALFSRALSFSVAPSRSVAPAPPSCCAVPHSPPAPSPPPPRTPALRSSSTSRTRNWSKTTRGHFVLPSPSVPRHGARAFSAAKTNTTARLPPHAPPRLPRHRGTHPASTLSAPNPSTHRPQLAFSPSSGDNYDFGGECPHPISAYCGI
uniref:Uncharacterized protein n=1 Tax=Oryza glumipatula TaxID=40148 RepID=A0A0E0BN25_9ORYZ